MYAYDTQALVHMQRIWQHLEEVAWLIRVAELFSYDFQTILHFANT